MIKISEVKNSIAGYKNIVDADHISSKEIEKNCIRKNSIIHLKYNSGVNIIGKFIEKNYSQNTRGKVYCPCITIEYLAVKDPRGIGYDSKNPVSNISLIGIKTIKKVLKKNIVHYHYPWIKKK